MQVVCGWLVFFRMSQTTALVKKAVMAVAGALTSDERLLLEERELLRRILEKVEAGELE